MKKFTLRGSLILVVLFLGFIFLNKSFVNEALAAPTEKVILIGGMDVSGGIVNSFTDVWSSSDLSTNTWSMLTNTPAWAPIPSVGMPKAVFFDNKIWVVLANTGNVSSSISYTSDGINWTNQSNLPFSFRVQETFFVFDDNTGGGEAMWILGGGGSSGIYNDVWKSYDGINWTLVLANAPWQKRGEHTSVVFDNKMWVMGGNANGANYEEDVWSSPDGINWTLENANAPWGPRTLHSSVVFDGKIWVFGGRIGIFGSIFDFDTWSSPDGVNWNLVSTNVPFISERNALASIVYDNKMWVVGGHNDISGADNNDVYSSVDGVNWTASTPLNGLFAKRFNHQLLVVPYTFGTCQLTVNPVPLPSTSLTVSGVGNPMVISKFEIVGCNEDVIAERFSLIVDQSTQAFRVTNPYIVSTSSSTQYPASSMTYFTNGFGLDVVFKPSSLIPQNTTVEFEIWANLTGDPADLFSFVDTLETQVLDISTIIPSISQPANIFPALPLVSQIMIF